MDITVKPDETFLHALMNYLSNRGVSNVRKYKFEIITNTSILTNITPSNPYVKIDSGDDIFIVLFEPNHGIVVECETLDEQKYIRRRIQATSIKIIRNEEGSEESTYYTLGYSVNCKPSGKGYRWIDLNSTQRAQNVFLIPKNPPPSSDKVLKLSSPKPSLPPVVPASPVASEVKSSKTRKRPVDESIINDDMDVSDSSYTSTATSSVSQSPKESTSGITPLVKKIRLQEKQIIPSSSATSTSSSTVRVHHINNGSQEAQIKIRQRYVKLPNMGPCV